MISFAKAAKTYRIDGRDTAALQPLDLAINAGEVFGVIGQSGAGKSTLIRLINLLERPTSGQVIVGGRDITTLDPSQLREFRREVGMIFQHFNLLDSKTVFENVAFPMRLARWPATQITERVAELLARVGLEDQAQKRPSQLSGGQKQRVGIARALATHPKILLCDEATSALDPQTTHSVLQLLAEINRELKLTIVLITHEMDVIRRVCDRVAVLDRGELVELGDVADVFLHPRHPVTQGLVREATGDPIAAASSVHAALRAEGLGDVPGRILRLTFRGEATYAPTLSRLARETGVDFNVLSGRVDRIKDMPYGQLTVAVLRGDVDAAHAKLTASGVDVEELG